MPRSRRPWIVNPHGPIEAIDEGLWAVEGAIPGLGERPRRRMFIVRRTDGTLVFSGAAVPLAEATLSEVRRLGRPGMLVVPHDLHMLDAHAFAQKLSIPIHGPAACLPKLRQRADIAGTLDDITPDPRVQIGSLEGTRKGEPFIAVRHGARGERISLLFADAIQNTPPGDLIWPFRLLGLGGGPKIVPPFRLVFVVNRQSLRAHLERLASTPGLARLVPCHGSIVEQEPAARLRAAAAVL
jgi:hypothetical protein